jgi:uncharacterized membrane protein
VAPAELPKELHWFKWEAYSTWLSGIALLTIAYYFNAQAMMIDKSVADLSSGRPSASASARWSSAGPCTTCCAAPAGQA